MLVTPAGEEFLRERHLATFSSVNSDGAPHVTPVGFTWDSATSTARVITSGTSRKAAHAGAGGMVTLCQMDGRRWLSLEGRARVSADPKDVSAAEGRYAQRYRTPRENPRRVVIEIVITNVYGSAEFLA